MQRILVRYGIIAFVVILLLLIGTVLFANKQLVKNTITPSIQPTKTQQPSQQKQLSCATNKDCPTGYSCKGVPACPSGQIRCMLVYLKCVKN